MRRGGGERRGRRELLRAALAGAVAAAVPGGRAGAGGRAGPRSASGSLPPERMERSFWVHATLGASVQKGYWGPDFPVGPLPAEAEVRNAVRRLAGECAANRLYLVYHRETAPESFVRLFGVWRAACPAGVELVPTLVLRMYDPAGTPVFAPEEAAALAARLRREGAARLAVYDVYPNRDQGPALAALAARCPEGLLRVGLQPEEALRPPFAGAVQDTWSGLCHGRTEADWRAPGFGAETLRGWVRRRRGERGRIAWNLVTVAWDYSATARGEYPGYDDADRNMPLPAGRNAQAAAEILAHADPPSFAGFSSDLFILHVNSASPRRDGPRDAFYATLKRGEPYAGWFAAPFREIAALYRGLRAGRLPGAP